MTKVCSYFNKVFKVLFEPCDELEKALLQRQPFESYSQLIDAAQEEISKMSESQRIAVVNAHPRIGAPKQSLSAMSALEQGSQEPNFENVLRILKTLNEAYENKFGFKFVVFVNGRPRSEIVKVLENRLLNDRLDELETGLKDMINIARDRLAKLSSGV